MDITDVIRDARSEHVVSFLLIAYIESLQFSNRLPSRVTYLPVNGVHDVSSRYQILLVELDSALRKLDDKTCALIAEALKVFGTALHRLALLHVATENAPAGLTNKNELGPRAYYMNQP